jgi:hypothetical protein
MQEAKEKDSSDDERLFTDEDSSDDEIIPHPKRAKQAIREEQNVAVSSNTEDTVESIDVRMKQETEEEKTTDEEEENDEENNNKEENKDDDDDDEEQVHIDYLWPHYHEILLTNPEKTVPMAFCCANCKCSDKKKEEYGAVRLFEKRVRPF